MPVQLTSEDARQSLSSHIATRGEEIRAKFGPHIGWRELLQILEDREAVRYPCEIVFSAEKLNPGEFAYPMCKGEKPEDGFTIYVHPVFKLQLEEVPGLVLYHLVVVNYGDFATSDDAEAFGAAVLGMTKDEYYDNLCSLADQTGCSSGEGCDCGC